MPEELSAQALPPIEPALIQELLQFASELGWNLQEFQGLSANALLTIVFGKTMALKGQQFIKMALLLLTRLSRYLPPTAVTALNNKLIVVLHAMIPNPPTDVLGNIPPSEDMGKRNMPYARSVLATKSKSDNPSSDFELPLPDKVFEQLLQRSDTEDPDTLANHPGGLSSLTFAFGTLVIHSVFNTQRPPKDSNINATSSYFDLAPLYGDTQEEQDEVRDKRHGGGLLHPDCFADARMLFLPPGAAVMLVLFNRNHNYIAKELLERNEKGTWTNPPPKDDAARAKQDDEIFETARLVNARHFVNIVITDYVGGVMGMVSRGGGWPGNAEALHDIEIDGKPTRRGDGNLVSIEFNLLYRWHATLSALDETWARGIFEKATHSHDWEHLRMADYERGGSFPVLSGPIKDREFAGLKRLSGGYFANQDLAGVLYNATEDPAGFFRAHGSPVVMKTFDISGIEQARKWKACTLNEFRTWLGLPAFKSFEDWNAAPAIANAARELYGDINRMELYPGLHAEGRNDDSFGITYPLLRVDTMRNGLLMDAIALIRGDPGLTTKFTPESATQWGYDDVSRDHNNRAFGGHIHNILTRTLPENFPHNSVYTWFPMSTPVAMKAFKELLAEPIDSWDFKRPTSSSPHK